MRSIHFAEVEHRAVRDRNRLRLTSAGLAVGLHLAILALFLDAHTAPTVGEGDGAGAMDVSLAGISAGSAPSSAHAAPATAAPPARPVPPAPADPIKPRSVLQIVSDILASPQPEHSVTPQPLVAAPTAAQATALASGSPGGACDIGGLVQTALRSNPDAQAAILLVPHAERAVADPVLLWNGQWIEPARVGGVTAFTTIRASIRQIVAMADPSCREREIVGPRFMLVPQGEETIVVVVGNASWRWSDMLVQNVP